MAGRYGLYGFNTSYGGGSSSSSSRGNSMRDEELNEEDVWGMGRESSPILRRASSSTSSKETTNFTALRRIPTASRMIPRAHNNNNNNNSSSTREPSVLQQSAPVNIPDWSKIYRKNLNVKKSTGSSSWVDDDDDVGTGHDLGEDRQHYGVDDDDDDDDDWLPPHEFIAKKLARSQISSFSVCEGVGRTLKGRDLTKVRNAVLTRTGFLQ